MAVHFTCGDRETAIAIMREAAQWLIDIGQPLWNIDDLTAEKLGNPAEEFWVLWNGTKSIAAMTLSFEDAFFWPDVPRGTSGFIHKLSIRREYASQGYAALLVEHAKKICRDKSICYLRLDCDPHRNGLMQFYYTCGFKLCETKSIYAPKLGKIDLAMFEMKI